MHRPPPPFLGLPRMLHCLISFPPWHLTLRRSLYICSNYSELEGWSSSQYFEPWVKACQLPSIKLPKFQSPQLLVYVCLNEFYCADWRIIWSKDLHKPQIRVKEFCCAPPIVYPQFQCAHVELRQCMIAIGSPDPKPSQDHSVKPTINKACKRLDRRLWNYSLM